MMKTVAISVKLLLLLNFSMYVFAQDANPVPALIVRSKPAVVAIAVSYATKLPEETQLPIVGNTTTPKGEVVGYLYISGTGFIVSADGYVVTAKHVVDDLPEPIQVIMFDGTIKPARLVSTSAEHDYAILKLDLKDAAFLRFGKYNDITEGDDLIYIGHPFGVLPEITSKGMVSWMGQLDNFGNAFQLNAIVNSGNSGGPLIDIKSGKVIGVVRAKYGQLSPYLEGLKNGTVGMTMNMFGGGFDFHRFVMDSINMIDVHIQMGIGYAVSTEYAEAELDKDRSKP